MAKKLSFFEKYLKPSFEKKLAEKAAKKEAKMAESNKKKSDAKKEKVDDQHEKAHLILSILARNAYDEKKAAEPKKQETPVEKPETIDVKPVENPEKPVETVNPVEKPIEVEKPAEQKAAETAEQQETPKPVAPQMIIKEGYQRKLSKAEKKALRKQKKREEAEKKASSPESSTTATATEKIEEAVAEGIETGEIDVVHKNPYIELIQSKVKSWDDQGNALDENGSIILDANGNIIKVDPKAGMILMAMPNPSQQQTATA